MRSSNPRERQRPRLVAMAFAAVVFGSGAACGGGGEGSVSSDQIERDAKVIFRADLKAGSTGATAVRIVRRFVGDGVAGTRGDDGKHVWVYGTPDATPEQIASVKKRLKQQPAVVSVRQLR